MTHALTFDSPKAHAARREFLIVVGLTLAMSVYMVLCTLGTLPVLGDGSQHYRRATVYYETGFPEYRINHDPAYPAEGFATVRYYDAGLWHMALAVLWRVLGRPSLLAAQIYQAVYFYGLVVFTYLIGRELYGRRGGLWAWLILMTIPMNILFGMVFYLEVPLLAFCAAAVYFLIRRRPILMGLALAGMFLTKTPSALVLTPPLIVASVFIMGSRWRSRILRTALGILFCLLVMLPDMAWRIQNFKQPIMIHDTAAAFDMQLKYQAEPLKQTAIPFSITSFGIDVKMFGVAGCLAVMAGIALAAVDSWRTVGRIVRAWRSEGLRVTVRSLPDLCGSEWLVAEVPLLFYLVGFLVMLHGAYDVRYFQPTVLFAAILSGGLLARLRPFTWHGPRRRWGRIGAGLFVLSMLVQWVAVPIYIHRTRRLAPEIVKGFDWIRNNPDTAGRKFLYLEANFTTLTGRPFVWAAAVPHYLFEVPEPEQMRLLYYLGVEYIAIHPTRQCETFERGTEPTAYPRPWVRSLAGRPYLVRVYPPGDPETLDGRFLIYHIEPAKVPTDWVEDLKLDEGNPYRATVPAAQDAARPQAAP